MILDGFIGPAYTSQSLNVDAQRCVNLYLEIDETGKGKARQPASLVGLHGLTTLLTLPESPVRGLWLTSKNTLFAVGGAKLYEISSSWVATERGALLTATGDVSMSDNGLQLMIVDGPYGYILTLATNIFAQIDDADFTGADKVVFQDGYFIFNIPNSGQFKITSLYDGTQIDGLDFATAEGSPDDIVSLISDHRELWIFGKKTTEVYFNSGNPDFPFERVQGAFIEHGCVSKGSAAKLNNTTFWVGADDRGDGVVWMAQGYAPQRISTHALEFAMRSYGDISDAKAFAYQYRGHGFYVLNFPSADKTWAFDTATGTWHERMFFNSGVEERHRADCHSFAFNTHVVGDYESGKIYKFNSDVFTDDGNTQVAIRTSPHLSQDLKRIFYSYFQLDVEVGVGTNTGQGQNPKIMMQFSDDGGHSWSNERWVNIGDIGQRKNRCIWRRLGQSRDRIFRVKISDPVKRTLIGAYVGAEEADGV